MVALAFLLQMEPLPSVETSPIPRVHIQQHHKGMDDSTEKVSGAHVVIHTLLGERPQK